MPGYSFSEYPFAYGSMKQTYYWTNCIALILYTDKRIYSSSVTIILSQVICADKDRNGETTVRMRDLKCRDVVEGILRIPSEFF